MNFFAMLAAAFYCLLIPKIIPYLGVLGVQYFSIEQINAYILSAIILPMFFLTFVGGAIAPLVIRLMNTDQRGILETFFGFIIGGIFVSFGYEKGMNYVGILGFHLLIFPVVATIGARCFAPFIIKSYDGKGLDLSVRQTNLGVLFVCILILLYLLLSGHSQYAALPFGFACLTGVLATASDKSQLSHELIGPLLIVFSLALLIGTSAWLEGGGYVWVAALIWAIAGLVLLTLLGAIHSTQEQEK